MDPLNAPTLGHERGAGELENVAVLLDRALETNGKARRFGRRAPPASFWSGEQDAPPVGAFQTHGAVALALGVRNADRGDTVTPTETRHLLRSSLHDAADADAALFKLRERLTQLRECLRVKGSAEMAQPQDERGSASPQLGQEMGVAGRGRVGELRDRIFNFWRAQHQYASHGRQS